MGLFFEKLNLRKIYLYLLVILCSVTNSIHCIIMKLVQKHGQQTSIPGILPGDILKEKNSTRDSVRNNLIYIFCNKNVRLLYIYF